MGVAGETPRQWFETLGKNIVHLHFIDGRPYNHLVWGDGLYPLEKYLNVLNEFGYEGLLGQEITDGRYFDDPAAADMRNFKAFEPVLRKLKGGNDMATPKLRREQVAGMNIHYVNYSLDYFLDAQQRIGFKSIELWCAAPHVWLDHMRYYDAKEIRRKIESRGLAVHVLTPGKLHLSVSVCGQRAGAYRAFVRLLLEWHSPCKRTGL